MCVMLLCGCQDILGILEPFFLQLCVSKYLAQLQRKVAFNYNLHATKYLRVAALNCAEM